MAEDDAIMKTRLLIDGDGMGDDRKINTLIRQIVKFASANADETPEDARKAHDRISNVLAACEASEAKSSLVREMNDAETMKYDKLYADIERGIEATREDIKRTKNDLDEARRVRKNRMQYDALAKVICKHPDRATTGKKLTDVEAEIARLETEEQILDAKLETRKKQFYVLVHSIQQLQEMLDEDDEDVGDMGSRSKSSDADAVDTSQASDEVATGMDVS